MKTFKMVAPKVFLSSLRDLARFKNGGKKRKAKNEAFAKWLANRPK